MWECTIGTVYFVLMLALQGAWQQRSGGFQLPSRSSDHVQQEIPDIPVHSSALSIPKAIWELCTILVS